MNTTGHPHGEPAVPEGFSILQGNDGGFKTHCGPYYVRMIDGAPVLGFRVRKWHLNTAGTCHGGALAAFSDFIGPLLRYLAGLHDREMTVITLSIDYIGAVPPDAWVELHARLLRRTQRMVFGDGVMTVDGAIVARMDGIYKILSAHHQGPPRDPTTVSAD